MVDDGYDPEDLIRRAYEQAGSSGKDRRTMSVAVLKNRMLSLSNGSFSEERHGAPNFLQFLKKYSSLVELDTKVQPPIASLLGALQESPLGPERPEHDSVPSDLWQAILDYSSGTTYVWDKGPRRARPAEPGETLPELPTVSEQELSVWKSEFATELTHLDPTSKGRVETWATNNLATRSLPASLRGPWNQELKNRVRARLEEFAREKHLSLPLDQSERGPTHSDPDLEAFRRLMVDCIKVMTTAELREIRVSPEVFLRFQKSRRQDGPE